RMVPIAIIYSRSEAMVVASLLDAAGILVHIGGFNHGSVSICQLALGGFKLTIPEFQHADASRVITSTPGFGDDIFSYALRRAVVKMMILVTVLFGLPMIVGLAMQEDRSPLSILLAPLVFLTIPVNPQGHSDYFLSGASEV
ncbi:MAG: hypothetical protein KBT59_00505, partial [Sphingomonadales bacterium]|nr:hypothetical protein [Sphingomonadales bacterium]